MGNVDSVPVISQCKSAVEAMTGNCDAALRTQINFSKQCIVVSQVRSAVEASLGDMDAALNTQIEYAKQIDGYPILSQVKSAVQAGCGDMEAATKTQENFSKQCVVVSQIRSAVEASLGDNSAALKTQQQFLNGPGVAQSGAIVGAVLGAVLLPVLVTASVTAVGFETTGILAGSTAAFFMSTYGGNVAAGSLCAILQSIGATGLSIWLSAALGLAGAQAGAIAASNIKNSVVDGKDAEKNKVNDHEKSN